MHIEEADWDAEKLIAAFGGTTETYRTLVNHGVFVTLSAVKQWFTRRRIPGNRVAALLQIGLDEGVIKQTNLADYIKVESGPF